jgi:uncharacterized membrane protein
MTTNVTHSTDVAVPVGTAYNQWTQFTTFPQFMDGVERIDQLTPTRTHWVTNIAHTRVTLQLDHDPEGFVEKAGDALGIVQRRVKGDLENFRKFIEARGSEEGGWRGDVDAAPQSR